MNRWMSWDIFKSQPTLPKAGREGGFYKQSEWQIYIFDFWFTILGPLLNNIDDQLTMTIHYDRDNILNSFFFDLNWLTMNVKMKRITTNAIAFDLFYWTSFVHFLKLNSILFVNAETCIFDGFFIVIVIQTLVSIALLLFFTV